MSLAMSKEEREAFLADVHVGVLGIADAGDRGPWMIPIWYAYQPGGDVRMVTGRDGRKMASLQAARRCSLTVQSEEPPYRYVTVEGPVVVDPAVDEAERAAIAGRYLGERQGQRYVQVTAAQVPGMVTVALRPERWLSADFSRA